METSWKYFRFKTLNNQRIYILWALILFIAVILFFIDLQGTWKRAQGHEYEWVAQSLAGGHGYSFDASHRWLFPEFINSTDTGYYSTAWVEPGYTLIMAGVFKLFGEAGRFVLVILQTVLWYVTALSMVYLATRLFNIWTGILASLILLLTPAIRFVAQQSLGTMMIGGLLVTVSALIIFWCLEKVSPLRGILLGLTLGIASLFHSGIFTFVPAAGLFILLVREVAFRKRLQTVLVLIITVFFVMSPWIIRNFVVFGQFVPLRNGFGFNSYIGNPPLVETYRSDFQACDVPPVKEVKATNPWEAVHATRQLEVQRAFYERADQCIGRIVGGKYVPLNEAGRDQEFLKETINFILERPILWVEVTIYKGFLFFGGSAARSFVSILAVLGVLLAIKNRKLVILFTLILAYSIPYIAALPFFYRYRYPIEPLILLFASSTIIFVLTFFYRKFLLKRE